MHGLRKFAVSRGASGRKNGRLSRAMPSVIFLRSSHFVGQTVPSSWQAGDSPGEHHYIGRQVTLLEPMEKVTFTIDESLQGDVNSIVSRSDGYIIDTLLKDNHEAEIDAIIPAACIEEVSETLRAESKGEGSYVTEFSHYQDVSDQKVKTICEKLCP